MSATAPTPADDPGAGPDVVLVHDYLTQRGGAERVVLAMCRTFPNAAVHTSVFAPSRTFAEFGHADVVTTGLNRIRMIRDDHRIGFPLYATAFGRHEVTADVVICSSSGWAHGVHTNAPKIVYCHTPARWLWAGRDYRDGLSRARLAALRTLSSPLRRWDRRAAHSAVRYLVNSNVIRDRVQRAYGIDAEVLHPPPGLDAAGPHRPIPGIDAGFLLVVSRLLPYKRVDLVIEAIRGRSERLLVIGSGPEAGSLAAMAPPNVTFLSDVEDDQLRWAYANAVCVVAMSKEDFGLVPLEAASFGTPTVAVRAGGYLDTVVEGTTGLFVDRPDVASLRAALADLEATQWSVDDLLRHADTFSEQAFGRRLRALAAEYARPAVPNRSSTGVSASPQPDRTPERVPR